MPTTQDHGCTQSVFFKQWNIIMLHVFFKTLYSISCGMVCALLLFLMLFVYVGVCVCVMYALFLKLKAIFLQISTQKYFFNKLNIKIGRVQEILSLK